MAKDDAKTETCPVDHKTRAAWLKSNVQKQEFPLPPSDHKFLSAEPSSHSSSSPDSQTPAPTTARGFFARFFSSSPTDSPKTSSALCNEREISTIPRASVLDDAKPANSEKESGVSKSGNWVYPSERMFFEAMRRKGYESREGDMKTIVPIHNAVNERAWREIREWERPWGSEKYFPFSIGYCIFE
ncbi:hypothetical protein B7494_g6587 [Chlorociboria aeruginascens]|nr:hypothetical protein B7494_g6587 [Chlorociboria aeruginascens]